MFDIIIPVYNTKVAYLQECLESVLNQTYTDWKCYIVNGTPSDSERFEEIHTYLKSVAQEDARFNYFLNTGDSGVSTQRNIAIRRGDNPYIVLLDSDDELDTEWLEKLQPIVNEDYSIYYGINEVASVSDMNTAQWKGVYHFNRYPFSIHIPREWKGVFHSVFILRTVGVCINRVDAERAGGFREEFNILEDTLFFRDIMEGKGDGGLKKDALFIGGVAGYVRSHDEQTTQMLDMEEEKKKTPNFFEEYPLPKREDKPHDYEETSWFWFMDLIEHHVSWFKRMTIEERIVPKTLGWEHLIQEEDDSIYD